MKKITAFLFALMMTIVLTAGNITSYGQQTDINRLSSETEKSAIQTSTKDENKMLVTYFSCADTTKQSAQYAFDVPGAELYEITPQEPYSETDLAYYTAGLSDKEQKNPAVLSAISNSIKNIEQYNAILPGYPIWREQTARIISTFLENYYLSGKTIVPVYNSQSSGIASSDTELHKFYPITKWIDGKRFSADTTKDEIKTWPKSPELTTEDISDVGVFNFNSRTVLLNSGYEMPINGLGTYSLHNDECINAVTAALNNGVRLIDTAHAYGNEEEIGKAIRNSNIPREEIFVITKLYPDQFSDPETAINEALEKLNIGYIDMMLLHHPGRDDVKAYKAIEQAIKDGKIRSAGLSNWYVKELEEFLPQIDIIPALVQNEIHPYYQENDVIPYIQNLDIVVQGWYPLGGREHTQELLNDPVILKIAKTHNKSSAQVILRWNLQKGVVVIPGSSNPDHIKENTELFDFELTDEEIAQINALDRNEKHDWY